MAWGRPEDLMLAFCEFTLFIEWPSQVALVGSSSVLDKQKKETNKNLARDGCGMEQVQVHILPLVADLHFCEFS
jgi:hypothetical protein